MSYFLTYVTSDGGSIPGLFALWTANDAVTGLSLDLMIAAVAIIVWAVAAVVVLAIVVLTFVLAILAQGIAMGDVLKTTYDFGYLVEGDPAEVNVEIENTSSEPIEITNVRTS